jgi:hypothetical protein
LGIGLRAITVWFWWKRTPENKPIMAAFNGQPTPGSPQFGVGFRDICINLGCTTHWTPDWTTLRAKQH